MPSLKVELGDVGVAMAILTVIVVVVAMVYQDSARKRRVAECYTRSNPCACIQSAGNAEDYTACRQLELYGKTQEKKPEVQYIYVPGSR